MEVRIDLRELDALGGRIKQAAAHAFRLTSLQLWGDIRQEAPVNTGRLAGSFEIAQISALSWRVFTAVSYALAVLEGTKPHVIEPRAARALHFRVQGDWVLVGKVNHPGTAANPYVDRAITSTESRIEDFVQQAIDAVGG